VVASKQIPSLCCALLFEKEHFIITPSVDPDRNNILHSAVLLHSQIHNLKSNLSHFPLKFHILAIPYTL
jgi:hypothetical protein